MCISFPFLLLSERQALLAEASVLLTQQIVPVVVVIFLNQPFQPSVAEAWLSHHSKDMVTQTTLPSSGSKAGKHYQTQAEEGSDCSCSLKKQVTATSEKGKGSKWKTMHP